MNMQIVSKDVRELSDGVMTYLKRNGRGSTAVPKVQRLLHRVTAQAKKDSVAIVETSVELTAVEKKRIKETLDKVFGRDINIQNVVTDEIVGGLRIQVGDWVVDTTIANQLSQLAMQLTTR